MPKKKAIKIEMEFPEEFEDVIVVENIKDQILNYMKETGTPVTSTTVSKKFNRHKRHSLEILHGLERNGKVKSKLQNVKAGKFYHETRVFYIK